MIERRGIRASSRWLPKTAAPYGLDRAGVIRSGKLGPRRAGKVFNLLDAAPGNRSLTPRASGLDWDLWLGRPRSAYNRGRTRLERLVGLCRGRSRRASHQLDLTRMAW